MRTIVSTISALVLSTSVAAVAAPAQSPSRTGSNDNAVRAHMSETAKKIHALTRRRIEEVQAALNNKDGAKLAVDGIYGPKTRAALEGFQKQNGLKVTGRADRATLQKLQLPHWT